MNTVAIMGVGLIGGSFGLALRENGFTGDIIGVSSQPAIEAGLKAGSITRTASLEEAAATADLIYLAQPVDRILNTMERLGAFVRPRVLVTDAGSTKSAIVQKAKESLPEVAFVGGHPLAGKEKGGAQAAQADLFLGKPYILTPHLPPTEAESDFRIWLARIGAQLVEMSPDEHDSTVAFTSHLPQLVSTALSLALSRQFESQPTEVFGSGLLDMTRLAMSSPELWMPILRTNKSAVLAALEMHSAALKDLQLSLQNDSLIELFRAGSKWAKELRNPRGGI